MFCLYYSDISTLKKKWLFKSLRLNLDTEEQFQD